MNKRELANYYAALENDAERDHRRRLVEDGSAPQPMVCGGSKFGRHRFTTRKTADGRLICDFCMQPRLEGHS